MKKFSKLKLNNAGVSLMTVVICMLFAAVIAVAVLTVATSNYKFASQRARDSKTNFEAEIVMDESRENLKSLAETAFSNAITSTMKTWSMRYGEDINEVFSEEFAREYIKILLDNEVIDANPPSGYPNGNKAQKAESIRDYLFSDPANNSVTIKISNISKLVNAADLGSGSVVEAYDEKNSATLSLNADHKLVFEDLTFKYTEKYKSNSVVTTDMVINVTFPTLTAEGAGEVQGNIGEGVSVELLDYALVSDGDIEFDDYYFDSVTVKGNVYTGGDFKALGPDVNLKSGKVVTKGDMHVTDGTVLNLTGTDGGANTQLWTNKIYIGANGDYSASDMNVKGDCYIGDHVILNGSGAGYGYITTFATYDSNSALYFYNSGSDAAFVLSEDSGVLLNNSHTYSSARAPKKLWIFGRDLGKYNSNYGKITMTSIKNNSDVQGGKAKFYLDAEGIKTSGGELYVPQDNSVTSNVDASTAAGKQTQIKADYTELLNRLDTDNLVDFALITTTNGLNQINEMNVAKGGPDMTTGIGEGYLEDESINRSALSKLVDTYIALGSVTISHTKLVDKQAEIIAGGSVDVRLSLSGESHGTFKGIIVAGGAVNLNCNFKGLIIAAGQVAVADGCSVEGTIISKDSVMKSGSGGFTALNSSDDQTFHDLILEELEYNPIMKALFKGSAGGEVPGPVDPPVGPSPSPEPGEGTGNNYNSISIEYDNWRKY